MTRFAALDPAPYRLPAALLEELCTPALVIHLDRVRDNLARIREALRGDVDRWRPHVKTTKIPTILSELIAVGVRHFKCATTREVGCLLEVLEEAGVQDADVLLAHPLRGPGLASLGRLAVHQAAALSVLVEDEDAVARVPGGVGIFVDVNPGMDRTGIPLGETARIVAVAVRAGDHLRGIHCYDGHLHDGTPESRRARAFAIYEQTCELLEALRGAGLQARELVTSGTPTFLHALAFEPFGRLPGTTHRVSPGTVVYHDLRSEQDLPELELVPAAVVVSRVVSHPTPQRVTCDAGSKSIAAEAGDPCAFVLGRPDLVPLAPSEEHLPLEVRSDSRPERGEVLSLVPRHVCPTVNLAEEALLVEPGQPPRVVPVSARAHELRVRG